MKTLGGGIIGALLLAACHHAPAAQTEPEKPAAESADEIIMTERDVLDRTGDTCGKAAMRAYLGKQASSVPADAIPEGARVLSPGSIATTDYISARLNILTDPGGMIIGMRCG